MSYSEDYAHEELCAQGEEFGKVESEFNIFVENYYGREFHKLSNSERANVKWQFKHRRTNQ